MKRFFPVWENYTEKTGLQCSQFVQFPPKLGWIRCPISYHANHKLNNCWKFCRYEILFCYIVFQLQLVCCVSYMRGWMFEKSGLCWTIIQKCDWYWYLQETSFFIFFLNFLFISENLKLDVKELTEESKWPCKRKLKLPIFSCQKHLLQWHKNYHTKAMGNFTSLYPVKVW